MYTTRNPALAATREKIEMARGRLTQAGLWPNPTFNFSQEGYPFGNSEDGFWEDQEHSIGFGQLFELGGKRGHRREMARLDLDARDFETENVLRLGRAQVKYAFLQAYYAQRRRNIAQDLLGTYEGLREIHQRRLEAGDVSGLSQLRINAEEIRYVTAVTQSQSDFTQSWNELAALLVWPGTGSPDLTLPEELERVDKQLEELKRVALKSRPDLDVQRLETKKSQVDVTLQESLKVPDLTVGGGYKQDFGQDSYYLGIELPLPLFNRNQGAIAERNADVRRNQSLLTWQQLQVVREVESAFEDFVTHRDNLERIQGSVIDEVNQVVAITGRAYLEGEATLLDYLDALRVQLDTSMNFYELTHQVRRAFVDLERAVGGSLN
jgi:cobalt-zinc-cadmium efflux system outer membrane protein